MNIEKIFPKDTDIVLSQHTSIFILEYEESSVLVEVNKSGPYPHSDSSKESYINKEHLIDLIKESEAVIYPPEDS